MLDKQKHIDDAVKDKLDGFELSPPPEAWGAIQAASSSNRKKGLWIFFTGLAVGIVVLGVWYFTQSSTSTSDQVQSIAENAEVLNDTNSKDNVNHSDNMASTVSGNNALDASKADKEMQTTNNNQEVSAANASTSAGNEKPTYNAVSSSAANSSSSASSNTAGTTNTSKNGLGSSSKPNDAETSGTSQNNSSANSTGSTSNQNSNSNRFGHKNTSTGSSSGQQPATTAANDASNSAGSSQKSSSGSGNSQPPINMVAENNVSTPSKLAMKMIVLAALPIDLEMGDLPMASGTSMSSHGRVFPRWRAHLGFGLNSFSQQFDKAMANNGVVENLEQNSIQSSGISADAGIAYYFTPGLYAETGYNYKSFSESYSFAYTDSATTYQIDTVGAYQDSVTGDTIYITDSTAMTNYLAVDGYQENFYKTHSIPLMLGYTFQVGRRWNFDVSGGVNVSIFSKFSGRAIENQDYDLIDLENSHKKAGLLSARAMIRANYLFGEKHGVFVGGSLSKHLSSFNNSNLFYDRKLRFAGLTAGYRIIF